MRLGWGPGQPPFAHTTDHEALAALTGDLFRTELEVVNLLYAPRKPIELPGAIDKLIKAPGMAGSVWINRDRRIIAPAARQPGIAITGCGAIGGRKICRGGCRQALGPIPRGIVRTRERKHRRMAAGGCARWIRTCGGDECRRAIKAGIRDE